MANPKCLLSPMADQRSGLTMESEIQQLVSMGFAADLAAEALAAADGDLHKATDRLLSATTAMTPNSLSSSQSNSTSPPIIQPKLDRFFNLNPKKDPHLQKPQTEPIESKEEPSSLIPSEKRRKISQNQQTQLPPPPPPLAERMRPRVLDEVVGQEHLLSKDSLLRSAISSNHLPSVVLWGPPGAGKTSIAKAIVATCGGGGYRFVSLSAVSCGVKEIRDTVAEALKLKIRVSKRTVLFLDEVHRFNKAQQDSFLPIIEDGSIVFIGATTENPSFHLITPLLSRCRVLMLNPLRPEYITVIVKRAIGDQERGLGCSFGRKVKCDVSDEAIEFLSLHCDGDARVALNALDVAAAKAFSRVKGSDMEGSVPLCEKSGLVVEDAVSWGSNPQPSFDTDLIWKDVRHCAKSLEHCPNEITSGMDGKRVVSVNVEDVKEALQCKHLAYDKAGEEHYNLISAVHKSMRGGDADAAIYWLARMLEGGEDPLYIARRLIRFASEDVGLADPQAMIQAVSCYQACHFVGMPECNVMLAQCVAYLALAPKSVAVYRAIEAAQKVVRESVGGNERVPLHLRNAPTKLMKDVGYGKGYLYPPDNPESLGLQTYLPPSLQGYKFLQWP